MFRNPRKLRTMTALRHIVWLFIIEGCDKQMLDGVDRRKHPTMAATRDL